MNLTSKILIILFVILSMNQAFAENHKNSLISEEEELPSVNPFLGGNTSSVSSDTNTESSSSINNLRLNGIIHGENKRFAIFNMPDGRSVRYEENTIISTNLMVLDILENNVYVKSNDQEYSIDINNIIIKVEE